MDVGSSVIDETWVLEVGQLMKSCLPASPRAAIQSADNAFREVCKADSCFPWNDCGFERPCRTKDAIASA
jgi:hypothetical protein